MAVKSTTQYKLINATRDKLIGNHRVQTRGIGDVYRSFFYHGTEICRVWDDKKVFWVDDSYGTKSTIQACVAYRTELTNAGYTERDK